MRACPILWWNTTVFALAGGRTVPGRLPAEGDGVGAFCAFVRNLEPAPKAIRLFYHSSTLEHFLTPCPQGNRKTIQRALGHRTPVLGDPAAVWAAHRVRPGGNGPATLLYVDTRARLARLEAALSEQGRAIEAAFPVLALVEEMADAENRERPQLFLLSSDEAAAVFWKTPAGDRHAAFFDGVTVRERVARELIEGFSIFKTPPVFTTLNAGSGPLDFGELAPGEFPQKPDRTLSVAELLGASERLRAREVYNFLPPGSPLTPDRLAQISALGLFCAGVLLAGAYVSAVRGARAGASIKQAEARALEAEIALLRSNQARVDGAGALLNEAAAAPPVKLRFLEALNRDRPSAISIRSVTLNESTWAVAGHVHEGGGKGPFQSFLAAFKKEPGWTVNADGQVVASGGDFTLSGTIP